MKMHSPRYLKIVTRLIAIMLYPADASKLTIRNLSGSIHYLLTDEILFMKANNKICDCNRMVLFPCRMTLTELENFPIHPIHKSYLVNKAYIREICRYTAVLSNGIQLPHREKMVYGLKKCLKERERVAEFSFYLKYKNAADSNRIRSVFIFYFIDNIYCGVMVAPQCP